MKKDIKSVFGAILREIRTKKGLTQQQLADFAGIDRKFISNMELGRKQPTLETFFKLTLGLGVKPGEIVNRIDRELNR